MVGDDMFATEGDSANVGRQSTATRENGRSGPVPVPADGRRVGGDVSADVLRRLRGRLREREHSRASPSPARTLLVRDGTRTIVVPHDDIVWIEAEDYCARIHLRDRTVLVRESLRSLVDELSGAGFVRVHRSLMVSAAHVRELQPWFQGAYVIVLRDGTRLISGRTYRDSVHALLDRYALPDRGVARE